MSEKLITRASHFISNWMWHSEERATVGMTWTTEQMKDVRLMVVEQLKMRDKAESELARLRSIIEGLECECKWYNDEIKCQTCRAKTEMAEEANKLGF